jgi:hypothetical protein
VPHQSAEILDLISLNENEDLLLQTSGGSEPARSLNGMMVLKRETQFSFYRRASEKNIQLPNLESLFSGLYVKVWRFKPNLVSIKEAMLNDL